MPVVSFIADGLEGRPGLSLFGPSPDLVNQLSSKSFQYVWFRDARLPTPPFTVFDGIENLAANLDDCLTRYGVLFVQPSYSSGGEQAAIIHSPQEFVRYTDRLRKMDRLTDTLVSARFIPDCRTLSGNGLVTRGGRVLLLGVDELLQDSYRFDGFIFPTFESPDVEDEILDLTRQVGRLLANRGYWGYFTADVIRPPDGSALLTEANVRFAGEAAFLAACTPYNLFRLLTDEEVLESDQLVPDMPDRIMATKIRPQIGEITVPCPANGSVDGFLSDGEERFRVYYISSPVRVASGHFVGLAGRRFPLFTEREEVIQFYRRRE